MSIAANWHSVVKQIAAAEARYHRPASSCQLLAISKGHSASAIRQAYAVGQRCFGESYLQEAIDKKLLLADYDEIEWHFIGKVQSNKTRLIATQFNWVHSIDRLKIARRLNEQRDISMSPLNVCIEVNISDQSSKSGVTSAESLLALANQISELPQLRLRGVMAIPEHYTSFDQQKSVFDKVAALQHHLLDNGVDVDTLSMGMSQDFEAAIAAGSTMVRIGTTIFGRR